MLSRRRQERRDDDQENAPPAHRPPIRIVELQWLGMAAWLSDSLFHMVVFDFCPLQRSITVEHELPWYPSHAVVALDRYLELRKILILPGLPLPGPTKQRSALANSIRSRHYLGHSKNIKHSRLNSSLNLRRSQASNCAKPKQNKTQLKESAPSSENHVLEIPPPENASRTSFQNIKRPRPHPRPACASMTLSKVCVRLFIVPLHVMYSVLASRIDIAAISFPCPCACYPK